ncbi:class I SAM-dependent RNA methyltransferase [Donghicola tyrosinivorans]|uniref:23S rRNA (Uracil1939-C5)-methyltransferase n=1 Tax=Donghicola tyrosinivorans TaxID=1652492 RepID=A0A2T0WYG8_9RHOB|nr:class I SAM-dependent RNA methyltransferase [Donghicola tyrosinivorans]PRY91742.1 23S rRNA (uracil1939-C5)-methyltransferase [Donghicola tyrosinivorans]
MPEVVIERLGLHGDGIAAGPIYVPMTLPGERVEGEIEGDVMVAPKIVEPSDVRVKAPCPRYKRCGGCSLQHAADGFVADWKVQVVRTALEAQGLEASISGIATSPANARRRAVFSARRTKAGAQVGFHVRGSDQIVEIDGCTLLEPALLDARPIVAELVKLGGSRKGELSVTVTLTRHGLDMSVAGGKPLDGPLRALLGPFAEEQKLARLAWGDETVALRLPPEQEFDGIAVAPPPGSFLQATKHGEVALRTAVLETVGDAAHVMDLFAGAGTFSLPLARKAEVWALEGVPEMIKAMDHGWRHAKGLKKLRGEVRDLFRNPVMAADMAKMDAVVLDPPRAGAQAQVAEIAASKVPVLAYVSCNPVTFARDAAVLVKSGYRLENVLVVDQFRWSTHVELAAAFRKE